MALPKIIETRRGKHVCPGRTVLLNEDALGESSFLYIVWFSEGYFSNKYDLSQAGAMEELPLYAWATNTPDPPKGDTDEMREIVSTILSKKPIDRRSYLEFAVCDQDSPSSPAAITAVEIIPEDKGWVAKF